MLSVSNGVYEDFQSSKFYDEPDYASEIVPMPPEDIELDWEEGEVNETVIDAVYGELTFEQFYQIQTDLALQEYISQNGGPLTFEQYCTVTNQRQLLRCPNDSPQWSPTNSAGEYVRTHIVNTLSDVVNLNDDELSLREAVALANGLQGKELITFADTLSGTITLSGTQLVLTGDVDIIGPGSGQITISGNDQSRIFYANKTDTTVTIEGLTLTNGYSSSDHGGAVVFYLASGVMHNVVVKDSVSDANAGGVYASSVESLTIDHCIIENNTASSATGYGGGAVVWS